MTPQPLRSKIIADRTEWIHRMLTQLRALPADDIEAFRSDPRNVAAAESPDAHSLALAGTRTLLGWPGLAAMALH